MCLYAVKAKEYPNASIPPPTREKVRIEFDGCLVMQVGTLRLSPSYRFCSKEKTHFLSSALDPSVFCSRPRSRSSSPVMLFPVIKFKYEFLVPPLPVIAQQRTHERTQMNNETNKLAHTHVYVHARSNFRSIRPS